VGVRDYPSGVTLSNVTALLQHLMQYPISNHFYSFSKARYQNTITTSLQGKLTTRFIYLQTYERETHPQRHVHPLTQSPLVSFFTIIILHSGLDFTVALNAHSPRQCCFNFCEATECCEVRYVSLLLHFLVISPKEDYETSF
jgi:hypothetical protein